MSGGGGVPGGRKGNRRHVDDLNLTPFVDLFSTLIIFLLSTAVMDQLAMMQLNVGVEDKPAAQVPPTEVKKINSQVKVTIGATKIELFDEGQVQRIERASIETPYDYAMLETFMESVRGKYPDKKDMLIFATDDAKYEDLVAVLDRSLAKDFQELITAGTDK